MTRALIAEFDDADRFLAALKLSKAEGLPAFDALTPFHMPQAAELLDRPCSVGLHGALGHV